MRWKSTSHPAMAKKMLNADLTDGSLGSRYISSIGVSVVSVAKVWLMASVKAGNEINKIGGAYCCVPASEEKSIWKGKEMTAIFKFR